MLEKLDAAGRAATATAAASAASTAPAGIAAAAAADSNAVVQMQLDEDMLEQMAEAAVPPAEGEEAIEERKSKVAEAKAGLRSRKGELEKDFSKVRRTIR